ncbi:MAG TPA: prolipoprotein diacylglyceryl transferase [Patescibacteria group bacterium]|jgi:phosphatidylglycerol:prolipoprotein diacylglycerol transferase
MAAAVSLGPLAVHWYSVFILAGAIAGYFLAKPEARRFRIEPRALQESIFFGVIPGIIGARLYHVLDEFGYYAADPGRVLAIWNGGLGILGGLAGGLLGLWYFARRCRISLLRLLDVWAPSVLLAQGIGRFGNWTNQEAFGPPTDLPWGVPIDPPHRPAEHATSTHFHPTFFYEAAWDFLGLVALLLLRPKLRATPGRVLGAYLVVYATGRFVVEFWRFDTAHVAGLPLAQLVAVAIAGTGIWLLARGRGRTVTAS